MKKLDIKYKLTYQEAYEAFYALATRRSRRTRVLIGAALAAVAVILLVLFAMDGTRAHYLFLAICSVALLFYIMYQPVLSARKGARQVERINGTYHVTLHDDETIDLPGEKGLKLFSDKYSRIVETDNVFAIRVDAAHTVCIPKRLLKDNEAGMIRGLI
ncbi:MAG: hypothetical protein IJH92_07515 [Mogibacterium sp.]|nr:hypothetical protein [Mogibacterium sp.]